MSSNILFRKCLVVDHFDAQYIEGWIRILVEKHDFSNWEDFIYHMETYVVSDQEIIAWTVVELTDNYTWKI